MKTTTYTAIVDADAIKTSVASATTAQSYAGGALNGARGATVRPLAQLVTITTAAAVGAYRVPGDLDAVDAAGNAYWPGRISIHGTGEHGEPQVDTVDLSNADGGETLTTSKAFGSVSRLDVPPMRTSGGAFTFGFGDIVVGRRGIVGFRAGGAGNLALEFDDASADTIALTEGERFDAAYLGGADRARFDVARVLGSTTTALPLTIVIA